MDIGDVIYSDVRARNTSPHILQSTEAKEWMSLSSLVEMDLHDDIFNFDDLFIQCLTAMRDLELLGYTGASYDPDFISYRVDGERLIYSLENVSQCKAIPLPLKSGGQSWGEDVKSLIFYMNYIVSGMVKYQKTIDVDDTLRDFKGKSLSEILPTVPLIKVRDTTTSQLVEGPHMPSNLTIFNELRGLINSRVYYEVLFIFVDLVQRGWRYGDSLIYENQREFLSACSYLSTLLFNPHQLKTVSEEMCRSILKASGGKLRSGFIYNSMSSFVEIEDTVMRFMSDDFWVRYFDLPRSRDLGSVPVARVSYRVREWINSMTENIYVSNKSETSHDSEIYKWFKEISKPPGKRKLVDGDDQGRIPEGWVRINRLPQRVQNTSEYESILSLFISCKGYRAGVSNLKVTDFIHEVKRREGYTSYIDSHYQTRVDLKLPGILHDDRFIISTDFLSLASINDSYLGNKYLVVEIKPWDDFNQILKRIKDLNVRGLIILSKGSSKVTESLILRTELISCETFLVGFNGCSNLRFETFIIPNKLHFIGWERLQEFKFDDRDLDMKNLDYVRRHGFLDKMSERDRSYIYYQSVGVKPIPVSRLKRRETQDEVSFLGAWSDIELNSEKLKSKIELRIPHSNLFITSFLYKYLDYARFTRFKVHSGDINEIARRAGSIFL
jgi:hypothetical protein